MHFSSDVDECVEAALAHRMICPPSAYCMNNLGSYVCTCPGDTQLIDEECIQCKHDNNNNYADLFTFQ